MPILNYTTKVKPERSIEQIQKALVGIGASAIMHEYADGQISAVSFRLEHDGYPVTFRLPARVDRVAQVLARDPKVEPRYMGEDHARSVAWRIVKDWVLVQCAIVEADAVDRVEVFLAYAVEPRSNLTMYEKLAGEDMRLLTGASKPHDGRGPG